MIPQPIAMIRNIDNNGIFIQARLGQGDHDAAHVVIN